LRGYQNVIRSRRVEVDPAFLAAYVGEYAAAASAPSAPGEWVTVFPYGTSLMMIFPDSHRYELFPQTETSFFVVTWNKMNERFQVQFEVNFGLDDATGRVLYMDFVFGPGDYVRNDRLNLESYVPYIPTPAPTATSRPTRTPLPSPTSQPTATAEPSATAEPTPALSATPPAVTLPPPVPAAEAGLPWGWTILPVALLAAAAGWAVIRRRRSTRR
jgi:hypothetical protein